MYTYALIFTFILSKTITFKGKENIMIEMIIILPFLSGSLLGKHEVDNRAKPEPKETANFLLDVHSALLLMCLFVYLRGGG